MNKLLAFFIIIGLLASPQSTRAQAGPVYIIQEGDTLYSIALRFNLTVDDLINANSLVNPDTLGIGDQLVIPGMEGVSGVLTSQIVPYGENLSSLSRRYAVSIDTIIKLNHLTSPAEVYAGANLIMPKANEDLPTFARTAKRPGETLLELSARSGAEPWAVLDDNRLEHAWQVSAGQSYFYPAGEGQPAGTAVDASIDAITVKGMPLVQGQTMVVDILTDQPVTLTGKWNTADLHFFSNEDNHYAALQGIHAMLAPGLYPLAVSGTLGDGTTFSYEQMVAVEQNFNFIGNRGDQPEKLTVDQSGLDPALNDPENELVLNMVSRINPQKAWTSPFSVPGYNREWLTSRFGTRRLYNNDPKIYFHTGVDFEGGTGLPVKAAAAGTVVFAGPLTVRGNATFIDHGWGVFTAYYHQSEIKVRVGDVVQPGQEIGVVGATGLRVTGAHLHWEVWVNTVQVNPLDWLDNIYP